LKVEEVVFMRRVLIYGAGEAGEMVRDEIMSRPEENIQVLGFIDDNPDKRGKCFGGVGVLGGRERLGTLIGELEINEVILAMPSIAKSTIREIVRTCKREKVKLLIVPSTREIIEGSVKYRQIRNIDPSDLLDREELPLQLDTIRQYLRGRTILVTGAAGSIGAELVHKLMLHEPGKLVLLDINENGLFYLLQSLKDYKGPAKTGIRACVSDIKDRTMLQDLFKTHGPEVVFHAAAYKHVPLMENNIRTIFLNNIVGTRNLLELSLRSGVKRFIGVSTDKAVYPVSVMGKTKRIGELLLKHYAQQGLCCSSVRFGNVLGSNGSVMTIFEKQIENGGPVTITSPQMKRYFMTLDEATSLVLQTGSLPGRGDVYVLDMGDPIRIRDLAENLIILSGLTPGNEIEIRYTGIRAGEKLSEDLFHRETEISHSSVRGVFIEKCPEQGTRLDVLLGEIERDVYHLDEEEIIQRLNDIVSLGLPDPDRSTRGRTKSIDK
jgi:FlaA1/EpsC-like NDP-sugar epimerase